MFGLFVIVATFATTVKVQGCDPGQASIRAKGYACAVCPKDYKYSNEDYECIPCKESFQTPGEGIFRICTPSNEGKPTVKTTTTEIPPTTTPTPTTQISTTLYSSAVSTTSTATQPTYISNTATYTSAMYPTFTHTVTTIADCATKPGQHTRLSPVVIAIIV
uniref:mucin-2-like isoform X2 n=1 Tax=Ciona intestinalis TaxID=7719 RepID=UPI000EF4AB95|nr:mucin-2-like isoform X2 [Ciona intestinalis]|eukprot:XP_026690250.1 mucin-2-like isoform X2 [Ciona intestinalis]